MLDQQVGKLCIVCRKQTILLKENEIYGTAIMYCPTINCWSRRIASKKSYSVDEDNDTNRQNSVPSSSSAGSKLFAENNEEVVETQSTTSTTAVEIASPQQTTVQVDYSKKDVCDPQSPSYEKTASRLSSPQPGESNENDMDDRDYSIASGRPSDSTNVISLNPITHIFNALYIVSANAAAVGRGSAVDVHRHVCDRVNEQNAKVAQQHNQEFIPDNQVFFRGIYGLEVQFQRVRGIQISYSFINPKTFHFICDFHKLPTGCERAAFKYHSRSRRLTSEQTVIWNEHHVFKPIYSFESEFSLRLKQDSIVGKNVHVGRFDVSIAEIMHRGCANEFHEDWYALLDDDERVCGEICIAFKLLN